MIKQFDGMKKPMKIMLISLSILFGLIFLYKAFGNFMMKRYFATHKNPIVTVSTAKVVSTSWQPRIQAVGSVRAILGVNVTAQLGGMIQNIYFTPGTTVTQGTLLVQQNADPNIAQLHVYQANAELANITYQRDKAQYKVKAISKQQLDSDEQNLKSLEAQVAQQKAIVAQLSITAPFTGRLGISKVNPGQYLNPGDTVVTLQKLDPIYVDFYLPQQFLARLQMGQTVKIVSDTFPKETFIGKITTINPLVEKDNRNVEVEATLANAQFKLTPGMFVNVEVMAGNPKSYLTVPQSAISFNPYGDIVYIVNQPKKDKKETPTVHQVFVTTGESRGDQITILTGLKEGDVIVTSGQLKLKNGSHIAINNKIQPPSDPAPLLSNEHDE